MWHWLPVSGLLVAVQAIGNGWHSTLALLLLRDEVIEFIADCCARRLQPLVSLVLN
jgi:hypothetical protein